jgi:uncharacterized protein YheU (UPF0270 family)
VSAPDDVSLYLVGDSPPQEPVPVPYTELSPEALDGVIQSFILREGTDYGEREFTLEQKIRQVRAQLERGDAQILFDPDTESVTIAAAGPTALKIP